MPDSAPVATAIRPRPGPEARAASRKSRVGLPLGADVRQELTEYQGSEVPQLVGAEDRHDPWTEAAASPVAGARQSGSSWMLHVLAFLEEKNLYNAWNFEANVHGNAAIAQTDIPGLYCPTRCGRLRGAADQARLLDPSWTGGGTDYGGSTGRQHTFENDSAADKHRFASVITEVEGERGSVLQGPFSLPVMRKRPAAGPRCIIARVLMAGRWGAWPRSFPRRPIRFPR